MLSLDPYKVYSINIWLPDTSTVLEEIAVGSSVERAVRDAQSKYTNYTRIVVFDSDTKDAVAIFKPNK